ncbi:MAG: hypothetical protein GY820_21280 [Gammaproteobacteria bacterium]|nr:hypothetical protein [Gammaproteobacteria bacterium]
MRECVFAFIGRLRQCGGAAMRQKFCRIHAHSFCQNKVDSSGCGNAAKSLDQSDARKGAGFIHSTAAIGPPYINHAYFAALPQTSYEW